MIVSASYRTDIPALYGEWFRRRLDAGFCRVANPYGGPPGLVRLDPEAAAGFVFWTRNAGPFLPVLDRLHGAGRPFVVQFTITGYPRTVEEGVIATRRAVAQGREIAARFGPRALVWRYDPVVTSGATPAAEHSRRFAVLADALAGATDEVTVSFVHAYRKTRRGLDRAGAAHGFTWEDPDLGAKCRLAAELAGLAQAHGMHLTVCSQPEIAVAAAARCIDAERLGDVAGRAIPAKSKGNRPGCACAESRDIGAYDTCVQGCAYCYAVSDPDRARRRLKAHDPAGEFLAGGAAPQTPEAREG